VAARKGFKLVRHKLELYGVCGDCQTRQTRTK
jgi:Fe2+ or Zn2+ uptake regulation protein